ncbi:MAG: hypothetical protein ACYCQI_10015 [Gammaproteobacteria bacterium]
MKSARQEHETVSGEFKTRGPILQAVRLPNGNFLCEHSNIRYGGTHLSIFDPIKNKTIATGRNHTIISICNSAHNYLYPLSDDTFLYHTTNMKVHLLKLKDKNICYVKDTKYYYYRINIGADNTLVGLRFDIPHATIDTIDIDTFKVKQTTPYDNKIGWNTLPSGMIFKYPYNKPIDQSKVLVLKTPHDEEPIKELEFKDENICFGESARALSNNIISYYIGKNSFLFHNILTNKTRQYPNLKFFVFADLGDKRILISTGKEFFLLDEQSLELTKIELGFDIDTSCISISCSEGVIALSFKESDMLFITHAAALTPKAVVVSTIMDSLLCMPEPLAGIIEGYRGLSLFNKKAKLDSDDTTKHKSSMTLDKR